MLVDMDTDMAIISLPLTTASAGGSSDDDEGTGSGYRLFTRRRRVHAARQVGGG